MFTSLPSSQLKETTLVDMKGVAAILLCGGEGKRLHPLTASRSKPALSVAGKYRLVDFPLSNAINSNCRKIFVLTQFLAASLHQHISTSYRQDRFSGGFIDLLACEQKPTKQQWYQGTADAVRQNLEYFIDCPVDYFLILSGDQIYQMDFQPLVQFAKETNADLVIASLPVDQELAKRMGIMKLDENNKITHFIEKPQNSEDIEAFSHNGRNLASMGIYLFKKDALINILNSNEGHDFGKDLIPALIASGNSFSYQFEGYWEDIGTIESFYRANLEITHAVTRGEFQFDPYGEKNPIFTSHHSLPGAKVLNGSIKNSLLGEGSILNADKIMHSVLGPRTIVNEGTSIQDSYIMGNTSYEKKQGIGKNCQIKKAIIDENVTIGNNVSLTNEKELDHFNSADVPGVHIRDSIIIVTRGTNIPANFKL